MDTVVHAPPPEPLDVAEDPRTPAAQLRRLLRNRNGEVRRAVASNPNTDVSTLAIAARHYPDAVATNPVLSWLLLENSNWLEELPEEARIRILSSDACPEGLLWWAARFGTVNDQIAVLTNRSVSADIADSIEESSQDSEVVETLAGHRLRSRRRADAPLRQRPGWERRFAKMIAAHSVYGVRPESVLFLGLHRIPGWMLAALPRADVEVRRLLATHPDTPQAVREGLLLDDDELVRAAARPGAQGTEKARNIALLEAGDPGLGDDALDALLGTGQTAYARVLCARHPSLGATRVASLATDADWHVRQAVAERPDLSLETMIIIVADHDRDVRRSLAANAATPPAILRVLAADTADIVRDAASASLRDAADEADGGRTDPSSFDDLLHDDALAVVAARLTTNMQKLVAFAGHDDWRVRRSAAMNALITREQLDRLGNDSDSDVRQEVASNAHTSVEMMERLAKDSVEAVRTRAAEYARYAHVLSKLAADAASGVRIAVARNAHADDACLLELAHDADAAVTHALALRPSLPHDVALRLALSSDDVTRRALAKRPNVSEDVLASVFRGNTRSVRTFQAMVSNQVISDDDALSLFQTESWLGVDLVSRATPASTLSTMASSGEWRIRQAVAAHPDTPVMALRALLDDSDYDVRAAAASNPRTPAADLQRRVGDEHHLVRLALAESGRASAALLAKLVLDDHEAVRTAAIHNQRTPLAAIEEVARVTAGESVPAAASRRIRQSGPYGRRLIAGHPAASPAQLRILATDTDWRIRLAVANNPATPRAALLVLQDDPDRDVRIALASRDDLPTKALERLANDGDHTIRRTVLLNPRLPGRTAASIRRSSTNAMLRSASVLERTLVLAVAPLVEQELRKRRNVESPHALIRFALAVNPASPREVLQRLEHDTNLDVAAEATHRLRKLARQPAVAVRPGPSPRSNSSASVPGSVQP